MDDHIVLNFFLASQREVFARVTTSYCTCINITEQPMTGVGVRVGGKHPGCLEKDSWFVGGEETFSVWV